MRKLTVIAALSLLSLGCPHRSPVWSPDGGRVLLLGGADGEPMDKPASRLWLLPYDPEGAAGSAAKRLRPLKDAESTRFLAVTWLDDASFAAFTVRWEDGETVEESEAIWRVEEDGGRWTRIEGPRPSAEHTPRRLPVVTRWPDGKPAGLAYRTADDAVVAIQLAGGGKLIEIAQAETVGPGPEGGFLIQRPDPETGGLELVAFGRGARELWKRSFGELAREIAALLGLERSEIVFNDTSTSILGRGGATIGVNLVFTDVSWNDGVQGFHAVLRAGDGAVLAAAGDTCLPGRPSVLGDPAAAAPWAWAVQPTTRRNVKSGSIRATNLAVAPGAKRAEGADLKLEGIAKSALHGYALDPAGKHFCVVVNGMATRLLVYPIEGAKITGKPREVTLE